MIRSRDGAGFAVLLVPPVLELWLEFGVSFFFLKRYYRKPRKGWSFGDERRYCCCCCWWCWCWGLAAASIGGGGVATAAAATTGAGGAGAASAGAAGAVGGGVGRCSAAVAAAVAAVSRVYSRSLGLRSGLLYYYVSPRGERCLPR